MRQSPFNLKAQKDESFHSVNDNPIIMDSPVSIIMAKERTCMEIQLVRHATLRVTYANRTLLVDPMLSRAGELAATPNTPNQRPNPLVELPVPAESVIAGIDAVLVTHIHRDHFDQAAADLLPKEIPVFCQPQDRERLTECGFLNVTPVADEIVWEGIRLGRTGGRHGTGDIGEKMGPVSGFVLRAEGEPCLYLAGDTIWCEEVERAAADHRPEVAVVFAGAAQFVTGGPITMTAEDVVCLAGACPSARIVVAHMEAWNHCLLSRSELRAHLRERELDGRVLVPEDGEVMRFDKTLP
jgi:L-ascorbate metabolism protein UlaG (beta-lactamase superfamily)